MCHVSSSPTPPLITTLPVTCKACRRHPARAFSPCAGTAGTGASGSSQTALSYSSPPHSLGVATRPQACEAGVEGAESQVGLKGKEQGKANSMVPCVQPPAHSVSVAEPFHDLSWSLMFPLPRMNLNTHGKPGTHIRAKRTTPRWEAFPALPRMSTSLRQGSRHLLLGARKHTLRQVYSP